MGNRDELLKGIIAEFDEFVKNAEKTENKAAQKRARKHSMNIRAMMKEFKKLSLEAK